MSSQSAGLPLELPFWRTVGASYAIVGRNFLQFVRISWLWLLIMLPVYAALHWLIRPWSAAALGGAGGTPLLVAMLPNVIELPALASIAVAWHRLVLQRERPEGAVYLRLDGVVWQYVLVLLAFLLVMLGPWALAMSWISGAPDTAAETTIAMGGFVFIVAVSLFVLPRLSLVLPGIALGERLTPARAWQVTRGNTWRLAMAGLLCSVPLVLPFALLFWYLDDGTAAPSVTVDTINSLVSVLLVTVAVTLLSVAYGHLVRQQEIGA
jgi:hypothetical protein